MEQTHSHSHKESHTPKSKIPHFYYFFRFFLHIRQHSHVPFEFVRFFFLCKSHEGHCSEDEQKITRKNEKKIPKAISMTMLLFTNTKRHIQAQIYKHIHPKISLLSAYEMRFLRIISFHFHFGFLFILNRIVIVIVIVFSF